MNKEKEIILASGSPRRKELMERVGLRFRVIKTDADEMTEKTVPSEAVIELSGRKAKSCLREYPEAIIVAADTVVAYEGNILGKPVDRADAERMLTMLSGKTHQVYTGVTVAWTEGEDKISRSKSFVECTEVEMYDNPAEWIRRYIATGEPMDKAGSYGIQGMGTMLVKRISGNYDNVVGLPVAELLRVLEDVR